MITLTRKQSGKRKQKKEKKNYLNCLDSYTTVKQRNTNFRADFISCSRWKTAVHITHARICPYYRSYRSTVRKAGRRWQS